MNDKQIEPLEFIIKVPVGGDKQPSGGPAKFAEVSFGPEDLIALAIVIMASGGVAVALIVAVALAFGKIETSAAVKVILGCVGGSSIAGVVAALVHARGVRRRSSNKQKK
jgi:hypothetical protein